MEPDAHTDIEVSFENNYNHWFTLDDVEEVAHRLGAHFEPRYVVRAGLSTTFYYPPPPDQVVSSADVIISVGSYVLANLDVIGLNVISNALYDAFKNFASRSHRITASFKINVIEKDNGNTRQISVEGEAHSDETIKELFGQAVDATKREFGDRD